MEKRLILFIILAFGTVNAAPLLMLSIESDIDSNIQILWERSITQVLKEGGFEPVKAEPERFAQCEDIECVISAARSSGARGLFRGRFRAAGKDSVSIRLHIDWLSGNSTPQTDIQGTVPLAWDNVLKSGLLLKLLAGIIGEPAVFEQNKNAVVRVITNPEDAVVMQNGKPVCKSPCEFSADDSVVQISAYWNSGENMWAAKTTAKVGKDTAKIFLELNRSFAGTEIRSNPSKALVFPAEILDAKLKALGKTPYNLRDLPGETKVRLFYEGYRDTVVDVNIDAVEKQVHFVQLVPLDDLQKIYDQNLLIKSRTKRSIGLGLLGGSIGPLAAGVFLCSLAGDDYQKARHIKEELNVPAFGGKNYKAKVEENHKAVKAGNSKMVFGASLIGVSVMLAVVGFSMSF
jgi:hypothetical protein